MENISKGIKILGVGSYTPEFAVKNADFEKFIETSDEWITSRTGMKTRHHNKGFMNLKMAAEAAKNALSDANVSADTIDYIMVSTVTPDFFYPSMACLVAHEIGAENPACADISAACTGFIEAVDMARNMLAIGDCKRILIIASENLTSVVDFNDRATCILFGDGAGAVVLENSDKAYSSYIGSKPENFDDMSIYGRVNYKINNPFGSEADETDRYGLKRLDKMLMDSENKDCKRSWHMGMNGQAVYKFAVDAMPYAVRRACEKAGITTDDIDIIIPHQANIRIINTAVKTLGIPKEKVHVIIEDTGNISTACIPTCLDRLKKENRLKDGMKVCMVGFGAGLTFGASIFEY